MFLKGKINKFVGRYIANENETAAQARNFLNFPQPQNQSWKKEPMGYAMMPEKVNSRVACFVDVKRGRVYRLAYDMDTKMPDFKDDKEYDVVFQGNRLLSAKERE